jgi:hypothetical protein
MGEKSTTSKAMNECWSLFGMFLNHVNTDVVFFHWLTPILAITFWLIRSRSCLLILPISDLAGLIRRQLGLFLKLILWSFKVINASRSAVILILSARFNFVAISLASSGNFLRNYNYWGQVSMHEGLFLTQFIQVHKNHLVLRRSASAIWIGGGWV